MHASFHARRSLGHQSCFQQGGRGAPTEVIHASEPSFPDTHDTEPGDTTNVEEMLSPRAPPDLPEELQEEPSGTVDGQNPA